MTWFGWTYLVLGFLGLLTCISQIGKPREPVKQETVVVQAILFVLYATAIFTIGTGHL